MIIIVIYTKVSNKNKARDKTLACEDKSHMSFRIELELLVVTSILSFDIDRYVLCPKAAKQHKMIPIERIMATMPRNF